MRERAQALLGRRDGCVARGSGGDPEALRVCRGLSLLFNATIHMVRFADPLKYLPFEFSVARALSTDVPESEEGLGCNRVDVNEVSIGHSSAEECSSAEGQPVQHEQQPWMDVSCEVQPKGYVVPLYSECVGLTLTAVPRKGRYALVHVVPRASLLFRPNKRRASSVFPACSPRPSYPNLNLFT